jgi:O-antigen/teichoic acid export membrane protein
LTGKELKEKAVSGFFWSFSDSITTQVAQFIIGLILARILSPDEFGLIGMITVFLAVAQSVTDSGFGQALIRKKDVTESDYSTVFYYNLAAGLLLFLVFYITAPAIADFYRRPELIQLSRVLGIIILLNSLSITQRTILTRKVNFRHLMKVNLVAAVISGTAAIIMALSGFGVWSLVWRAIINSIIQAIMLFYSNRWVPAPVFSGESFRSLFSFGSRLLVSGLIDTIYRNLYLLIIGRFFSASDLGFYTRADQFSRLASQNLTGTVQRVSYPVLSQVQDDNERLKAGYRKLILSTMFVTFFLMLGMAAVAKPMIITLIGEKWLPAVEYLQLLCLSAMFFPLHALNLNILNVKGRSDLFLRLEIVKKLLAIPVIVAGVMLGIRAMLIGMVLLSVVSYYLNARFSGRLIGYSVTEQLADIMPSFIPAVCVSAIVFPITLAAGIAPVLMLTIQLFALLFLTVLAGRVLRNRGYQEIREIVISRIPRLKNIL